MVEQLPNRKLNRLENYDYLQDGYYFVTICAQNREHVFCEIKNETIVLNEYGEIVKNQWINLPNHYKNCVLDDYVLMPNHIHGIVIIENDVRNGLSRNGLKPFPTDKKHGLSEMMRGFKTFSSKNINIKYGEKIFQWQKSFYEHVIRNEKSLFYIREYIQNNPLKWELEKDKYHLSNLEI